MSDFLKGYFLRVPGHCAYLHVLRRYIELERCGNFVIRTTPAPKVDSSLLPIQGNRERDKEAAGRGERGLRLHPGQLRQAGPGAAQARVCQVLEALLQHAQGVLQGGTVSERCVDKPGLCLKTISTGQINLIRKLRMSELFVGTPRV